MGIFMICRLGCLVSLLVSPVAALAAAPVPAQWLIIPQPKSIQVGTGAFVWPLHANWTLQAPVREERLWVAASDVFRSRNGQFLTNSAFGYCLQVGAGPVAMLPAGSAAPAWATNAEGYRLFIHTNGLLIQSTTAQGAFYGLQTLAQLRSRQGSNLSCPAVEILDWPSLRFRGVHWFPSAAGVAMDERLIQNIFSAFKFNHCVIQCEAARWDSHPEIAPRQGIAIPDLRKLVAACRSRFLEPVPLIDVPGHADWMFRHGQNTNLIEDPQTPYAVCVRNPKTIQLIEDLMAECLEVFHPGIFHLGFDEITLRGRFPNPDCPFCHGATATTLMAESAGQLTTWLAARGVAAMIWGDMLLGPGEAADATNAKTVAEARERRAALAKNLTIADWHYVWNADRTSLDVLQQAGFHTIASTWAEPVNIYRFSQAALASGADGLLQTTWAGFFPEEREIQPEIAQYAAYILAADYAWSGRNDPPDRLGYAAKAVFLQAYAAQPVSLDSPERSP